MVACGILGLSFVHDGRRLKFDEISIRLLKPYLFHKSFPLFSPDPSSLSRLCSVCGLFLDMALMCGGSLLLVGLVKAEESV